MMRAIMVLGLLAASSGAATAQGGPPADRLREQVVQRFMENYRVQAGLSDEQFGRVQTTVRRFWDERRDLEQRERQLLRGLEGQLRPGVAADPDSVTALIDELLQVQASRSALARREQEEFAAFLNPVQRAQLVLAFVRLERQIDQILQNRRDGMGPRRIPG
jgi:hypothetical protein